MKVNIQSISDVITNSSTEIYQIATSYSVQAVKDIIDAVLNISGSGKKCDDLFWVGIDYAYVYESYIDDYVSNFEFIDQIDDKIAKLILDSDLSYEEKFNKLNSTGLICEGKLNTIEQFVNDSEASDTGHLESQICIRAKNNPKLFVKEFSAINNLFEISAEYNG